MQAENVCVLKIKAQNACEIKIDRNKTLSVIAHINEKASNGGKELNTALTSY